MANDVTQVDLLDEIVGDLEFANESLESVHVAGLSLAQKYPQACQQTFLKCVCWRNLRNPRRIIYHQYLVFSSSCLALTVQKQSIPGILSHHFFLTFLDWKVAAFKVCF